MVMLNKLLRSYISNRSKYVCAHKSNERVLSKEVCIHYWMCQDSAQFTQGKKNKNTTQLNWDTEENLKTGKHSPHNVWGSFIMYSEKEK